MDRQQLLKRLDKAWAELKEAYAGLSDSQLTELVVTGKWSVKDILAHVTTWEQEALMYLPLVLQGGRPARYSVKYGGIDAFNAQMTEQKTGLALSDAACGSIPTAITRSMPRRYGSGERGLHNQSELASLLLLRRRSQVVRRRSAKGL